MARRDAEEFTAFVAASSPSLRRTAYLMCGDWELASDHVQEALIRVYRAWPRLHRDGRLLAYARRAVISAAIDAGRKRSSTEVPVDRIVDRGTGQDDAAAVAERDALQRCLSRLGGRQRACVVLRHYDDMSVAEVAEILGCSEGTVRSQTARALTTLAALWAEETGDDALVANGGRES
jgi:RNA polymerase sigma-70 factor (sigma-E family)